MLFYELLSWADFLRGGSYVYQQGMKRMSGNMASEVASVLPINGGRYLRLPAVCSFCQTPGAIQVAGLHGHQLFPVLLVSIIFSGTPGAMVVAVLYTCFVLRRYVFKLKTLLMIGLLILVALPLLPEKIVTRYWDQLLFSSSEIDDRESQGAIRSRDSRIEGLVDGFRIANRWPLTGSGPGTSAYTRTLVKPGNGFIASEIESENYLQLHNLYGQIPAELGYPGLLWAAILIGICINKLRRAGTGREWDSDEMGQLRLLLGGLLFIMLLYGMVSHTLYDFKWLFLMAMLTCFDALATEIESDSQQWRNTIAAAEPTNE